MVGSFHTETSSKRLLIEKHAPLLEQVGRGKSITSSLPTASKREIGSLSSESISVSQVTPLISTLLSFPFLSFPILSLPAEVQRLVQRDLLEPFSVEVNRERERKEVN